MKTFKRLCLIISFVTILLGITLIIIGFGLRGYITKDTNGNYDFSKTYKKVKSVDMDISYGSVTIKEGDSFHIEASNMNEQEFNSTLKNGVWRIQSNDKSDNNIDLFGFNLPINAINIQTEEDIPKIIITLPSDFTAEQIDLKLDAGAMKADKIKAEEANIIVSAGSIRIHEVSINNTSYYSVDTGELIIDNINANNVKFENGIGNIQVTGNITGDNYVESGIGAVDINLNDYVNNYNYSIDCGIGSVRINNNKYYEATINNGAINNFDIDCGIGEITLDFTKKSQSSAE